MDEIQLSLNQESADALREFARSIPLAVNEIVDATERLTATYDQLQEGLGEHAEDFKDLIQKICKMQETAKDAIDTLPARLNTAACKIEDYLKHHPAIG